MKSHEMVPFGNNWIPIALAHQLFVLWLVAATIVVGLILWLYWRSGQGNAGKRSAPHKRGAKRRRKPKPN